MAKESASGIARSTGHGGPKDDAPFGANEMRLTARQWVATFVIFLAFLLAVPPIWERCERFDTAADYRIPYALSSDYWLYSRPKFCPANSTPTPATR